MSKPHRGDNSCTIFSEVKRLERQSWAISVLFKKKKNFLTLENNYVTDKHSSDVGEALCFFLLLVFVVVVFFTKEKGCYCSKKCVCCILMQSDCVF